MKYRATPFNVLGGIIFLRILWIIIASLLMHENLNTWSLLIVTIFLISVIPFMLLGIDYAIQSSFRNKKYIFIFTIELATIVVVALLLWCFGNIKSLHDLTYYV